MQNVVQWVTDNWVVILAVLVALTNVLNAATNHWSNYSGLKRFALFMSEVVSVLASKDSSKVLKVPGQTE